MSSPTSGNWRSWLPDSMLAPQPNPYPHKTGSPGPYTQPEPAATGFPIDKLRDVWQQGIVGPISNALNPQRNVNPNESRTPTSLSLLGIKPSGARLPKTGGGSSPDDNVFYRQFLGNQSGANIPVTAPVTRPAGNYAKNPPLNPNWNSGGSPESSGGDDSWGYSNQRSRNAWLDGLRPGLSGWADAFEDEHEGRGLFEVYGGAPAEELSNSQVNYALSDALLDKAWGDKFYDTYRRPPSEDDWKASYYDREGLKRRQESPTGGPWRG